MADSGFGRMNQFQNGFEQGVAIRNLPIVNMHARMVFWVDSSSSSIGGGCTLLRPGPTIATALALCVASRGDIIMCKPGHAETITAAAGIALATAGVTVIGLGRGDDRPTLTFSTATTASLTIAGASVSLLNFICKATFNALANPINITGNGVTVDIEWRDTATNLEANRAILATSVSRLAVNIRYMGQTGGSSCVNAVRLVGCTECTILTNCYGKASTAWVEFLTTACVGVRVSGFMYNSGTTNYTKNVVDTATGSTWYAAIDDGAAGFPISGGSGSALGPAAAATVIADLAVPSTDAATNALERDVLGSKADTIVYSSSSTASNQAYTKGLADAQVKFAASATAVMVNNNTIFTVAGGAIKIEALYSICIAGNDATASTLQYSITPTVGSATTISGASGSLANALAGATITLAGTALATAALLGATGPNLIANPGTILCPAGTIKVVIGVGSTTGTWKHFIRYMPLATGVSVS